MTAKRFLVHKIQTRNLTITATEALLTYLIPLFITAISCWLLVSARTTRFAISAWLGILFGYVGNFSFSHWQRLADDAQTFAGIWASLWDALTRLATPKLDVQWVPLGLTVALVVTLAIQWTKISPKKPFGFATFAAIALSLNTTLMSLILWNSTYFAANKPFFQRAAYVVIPGLLLTLVWLASCTRKNHEIEIAESATDTKSTSPDLDSMVGWLAALALPLSATLLLASSGTLSLALKALIPAVIPAAQFFQRKSQHNSSSMAAGWISLAVCLPVILGHFFAEVSFWQAVLLVLSACLTLWLWPRKSDSLLKQWTVSFACVGPALLASGIAALSLLSELSNQSTDGY